MYGRGHYKDKYIVVKVPKKDIGNTTYEAGLYMLKEVTDFLNKEINGTNLEKVYGIISFSMSFFIASVSSG